jgi:hypothetical protein
MNHELKMRMLNAAIDAAPEESKVLSDAIKEIDRLHMVLVQVHDAMGVMEQKIGTVVPLLTRLSEPTESMLEAMSGEAPYIWRRKMDKSGYEVVYLGDNPDWRTVIAEPQVTVFETRDSAEATERCEKLQREWRYHEMMRVAGEQT